MPKVIFLLGGARSGKSRLAEEMVTRISARVLFVATATGGDAEMRSRIAHHQQNRPTGWRTLEASLDVGNQIQSNLTDIGVVILDCITLLVSNIFCTFDEKQFENTPDSVLEEKVAGEISGILTCLKSPGISFILVSNEVGLGIVPDNRMGRLFRDCLGRANQNLAQAADEVYFLMAGILIRIK